MDDRELFGLLRCHHCRWTNVRDRRRGMPRRRYRCDCCGQVNRLTPSLLRWAFCSRRDLPTLHTPPTVRITRSWPPAPHDTVRGTAPS